MNYFALIRSFPIFGLPIFLSNQFINFVIDIYVLTIFEKSLLCKLHYMLLSIPLFKYGCGSFFLNLP